MINPEFDFSPDFSTRERLFYIDLLNIAEIERPLLEPLIEDLRRITEKPETPDSVVDQINIKLRIEDAKRPSYAEVERLAAESDMGVSPSVALTFYDMLPDVHEFEKALQDNKLDSASYITVPDDRSEEDFMAALLLAAHATGYSLFAIVDGVITTACPWMSLEEVKEQHQGADPQSSNRPQ